MLRPCPCRRRLRTLPASASSPSSAEGTGRLQSLAAALFSPGGREIRHSLGTGWTSPRRFASSCVMLAATLLAQLTGQPCSPCRRTCVVRSFLSFAAIQPTGLPENDRDTGLPKARRAPFSRGGHLSRFWCATTTLFPLLLAPNLALCHSRANKHTTTLRPNSRRRPPHHLLHARRLPVQLGRRQVRNPRPWGRRGAACSPENRILHQLRRRGGPEQQSGVQTFLCSGRTFEATIRGLECPYPFDV